jgi:DNA polymerase-1
LILEFRELDKLKSTYTDTLPEKIAADGRVHGKLNQTVAATGRLSSTDPNLQNIPIRTELGQKIRSAFVSDEGNLLISVDYSQLELRILAHVTQDEVLLDAFQKGEDIHARTAKLVFGDESQRRLAKIINFGIAYAVEAYGLSQRIGLSVSESKKIIQDYYETYQGVKKYMDETPEFAREHGYVASIFGRRRPLPSIHDKNYNVRSRAEREAINMPVQGTASDIVKIAMLKVDKALTKEGLEAKLIMQIHDELLFEVPKNELETVCQIVKKEMENAVELDVPLIAEVGIGKDWMNAK